MKYKQIIFVTALLIFLLLPGNIWGQEEESPEGKSDISLFLGASSSSSDIAFTIGVDYQYRINRVFGVGGVLDHATGDFQSTLVAPALFLHVKQLSFTIAPGLEFSGEETEFVVRIGAEYEFELSRFAIVPGVFYDTERDGFPTWVYGVAFSIEL